MLFRLRNLKLIETTALLSAAVSAVAANPNTDYITPPFTFSPDHRYGVMIPVWHDEGAQEPDDRLNKVVELATNRVVAVIHGEPGYNRALNFHETAPPHWSADSSVLLWKVNGKWFPDALVLIKLSGEKEQWQVDLMKTSQRAILARTKEASPRRYAAAKRANAGNGSAYPEGFTVDVTTDEEITFPFHVRVDLTANPKEIPNFPADLDSHLDATVDRDGKCTVTKFTLGRRSNTPRFGDLIPSEEKRPNQAMQLTAPRSVSPFRVATTFNWQRRALPGAVADLESR